MITVQQLRESAQLDELQWRAAWSPARPPEDIHEEVPLSQCHQIWLYSLLRRIKFLSTDAANLVFDTIRDYLPQNPEMLIFGEGQWCSFSGFTGWLSLESGQVRQELPVPLVETRAYNLRVYYARQQEICRRLTLARGENNAASSFAASPEDCD